MRIPIDKGWLPDIVPFDMPQGGLCRCENLLPYDEYYASVSSPVTYSSEAVTTVPRSAIEIKPGTSSTKYVMIGTSDAIFRLESDASVTDVTRIAAAYACGENTWNWVLYGDWIIATNYVDVPQILKNVPAGTNFAALGGTTPPRAKYCTLYNGHLVFGYTYESSTAYPKRLRWSAHEDVENWTVSLTTQCGYQDIQDADGDMTGIARVGSSLALFFENSITIAYYSGYPYTLGYAVNKYSDVGALPNTMISVGDKCYFWSNHGIHELSEAGIVDVGLGVRNTVLSSLDQGYIYRITRHHDIKHGLIWWSYTSTQASAGTPDRILIYNYRLKKFSIVSCNVGCIFGITSGAVLLDAMTYTDLEDVPYPIDSNVWLANNPSIGCLSTTNYVQTFSGTALASVIETGDLKEDDDKKILQISDIRPMIRDATAADVSVSIGYRNSPNEGVVYSTAEPMQPSEDIGKK
jgi:hypothetical protein